MFVVKPASFGSTVRHIFVWRRRCSEAPSSAQLHFELHAGDHAAKCIYCFTVLRLHLCLPYGTCMVFYNQLQ